jgi:sulfatase maturation enzyme AslB (radical SAM superfamily)
MKKYKSCKYIENSLYLAPNEIRACCQRFHHKGKMRGDAVLLDTSKIKDNKIDSSTIKVAREKMNNLLQEDKIDACLGCRYIENVENKPKIKSDVNFLSIEHHSFCNLRCTYCSEIYYGGQKPNYDVLHLITSLKEEGKLKTCDQVVWGGGEPTLEKDFEKLVIEINKTASPKIYHRIFTNSVRYSAPIFNFLKQNLIKIVTSIDAGTRETYKKIRGRDKYNDVYDNLIKYSEAGANNITIKYIITEENNSKLEFESFAKKFSKGELKNACYQISLNYKYEKLTIENFNSALFLMHTLYKNGINKVFIDDHILAKLVELNGQNLKTVKDFLKKNDISNLIIDKTKHNSLILYGAGQIAKEIIEKTLYFKDNLNFDIVDENKVNQKFLGKIVKNPDTIKEDQRSIYITSAQSYDTIYSNIVKLKGDNVKILTGVFI